MLKRVLLTACRIVTPEFNCSTAPDYGRPCGTEILKRLSVETHKPVNLRKRCVGGRPKSKLSGSASSAWELLAGATGPRPHLDTLVQQIASARLYIP